MKQSSTEPFVHVLLFECPRCSSPVAAAVKSDRRNLEIVDGHSFTLRCACGWSDNTKGTEAKRHWVAEGGDQC